MTDSNFENLSDYGILNPEACDPGLRGRVVAAIKPKDSSELCLTPEQFTEIATYINQLEDALLRHHWGSMSDHAILELLKCSTGLDIEARSQEISAMTASDA